MITLVIDDHIPFIKGVLEPFASIIYAKGGMVDHELASKADGLIIRTRTRCDEALLKGTKVRFIATATIGIDHIDTKYCNDNGISWFHAPGCNANSVRQYVASVLANLHFKFGFDLEGKRIGIIGAGHVGSKVQNLAELFGMVPLVNDPPRERAEGAGNFVSLSEIKETCDFITFHVPLNPDGTDKTLHLADQDFFASLQRKPVIINTSRGPVVDSEAVKQALQAGRISAFIADVWEKEPNVDRELLEMSLVATPHIAGYSVEGKANGTAVCVKAASRFFGLSGLENWAPSHLPGPEQPVIQINEAGKPEDEVFCEAILNAYDVMQDDLPFRSDPDRFEDLRNHYPSRREFGAFQLKLKNGNSELSNKLEHLGFPRLTADR